VGRTHNPAVPSRPSRRRRLGRSAHGARPAGRHRKELWWSHHRPRSRRPPQHGVRIASAPLSDSPRPGPEQLDRLPTKLADASQIATPVLFWLPSSGREASLLEALANQAGRAAAPFQVASASPAFALASRTPRGGGSTRSGRAAACRAGRRGRLTGVPEQATAAERGFDAAREREETRRRLREAGRQFVRRTCPEPLSRDDIRELAQIVAAGLLASKLDADRGLKNLGVAEPLRAPEAAGRK
jgi:hypothetical protein